MREIFTNIYSGQTLPKISINAIQYLAKQLDSLIKLYDKNILISNVEDFNKLNQLRKISNILNEGRYDLLITSPYEIIDFSDPKEDYCPEYYSP